MAAEVDTETGELTPADFPDVRLDRRFLAKRDGKDVVLYAGLLDLLHQLSEGYFDIATTLVQIPNEANGQTAICTARVVIFDRDNPDVARRVASGIGDAAPGNVTRPMVPHLIRMAETRAKARALRDAVNVGMAALEELGPGGPETGADERTPAPAQNARPAPTSSTAPVPTEHILIAGKPYTRGEVLATYYKRIEQAKANGIVLGEVDVVPPEQAPLASLVAKSQEIRRRLDARASGK